MPDINEDDAIKIEIQILISILQITSIDLFDKILSQMVHDQTNSLNLHSSHVPYPMPSYGIRHNTNKIDSNIL